MKEENRTVMWVILGILLLPAVLITVGLVLVLIVFSLIGVSVAGI